MLLPPLEPVARSPRIVWFARNGIAALRLCIETYSRYAVLGLKRISLYLSCPGFFRRPGAVERLVRLRKSAEGSKPFVLAAALSASP
jgi:hypothetical protein